MRSIITSRWTRRLLNMAVMVGTASIANCDEPTITVSGDAEIRVAPDQVVITAGIDSRAKSVADATEENDKAIRGVLDFLEQSGIEEKYIHTEHISIRAIQGESRYFRKSQQANAPVGQSDDPFGDRSKEVVEQPLGYSVSRQFAITIVDLKKFEAIYKGLIELGINRVQGIEFRASELRKFRDQARLQAVRAAKDKAQALSAELGATLSSVKIIRESGTGHGYRGHMAQNTVTDPFGDESDTAGFAAGQIAITASVEVVFILGKTELDN